MRSDAEWLMANVESFLTSDFTDGHRSEVMTIILHSYPCLPEIRG